MGSTIYSTESILKDIGKIRFCEDARRYDEGKDRLRPKMGVTINKKFHNTEKPRVSFDLT